jgi:hypothetical protein
MKHTILFTLGFASIVVALPTTNPSYRASNEASPGRSFERRQLGILDMISKWDKIATGFGIFDHEKKPDNAFDDNGYQKIPERSVASLTQEHKSDKPANILQDIDNVTYDNDAALFGFLVNTLLTAHKEDDQRVQSTSIKLVLPQDSAGRLQQTIGRLSTHYFHLLPPMLDKIGLNDKDEFMEKFEKCLPKLAERISKQLDQQNELGLSQMGGPDKYAEAEDPELPILGGLAEYSFELETHFC